MNVSVIIVNYNTTALVYQCIKSIYDKTQGGAFEIIIVDNDSSDKSIDSITSDFPHILLVKSIQNLGFGKANNLGAKYAKGDYLFLLNPDTYLINNAIEILYSYIFNKQSVGICGGNLFDNDMHPNNSFSMSFPSITDEIDILMGRFLSKILHKDNFNYTNLPKPVSYITGADLMISRKLFNELEGFSPDFFMYFEETELSYRVRKLGYDIISVPQAKIVHLEGKSFSVEERKLRMYYEGRKIFYLKCYSYLYRTISNVIFRFTCLTRILFYSMMKHRALSSWKTVWTVFNEVNRKA